MGGEVIGSVLVSRPARYQAPERRSVRDAVSQAAPVLANLRNLAIAETRAADRRADRPAEPAGGRRTPSSRMFAQAGAHAAARWR